MNQTLYCFLRRLVLGGMLLLLGGLPHAGWAQMPVFGPAITVSAATNLTQHVVAGVATDAQGYLYVAGIFSGTVQFGSTTLTTGSSNAYITNCFVAKLDGAGTYQWARALGGPSYSYSGGLAVDASGTVTVAGSFYGATAIVGPYTLVGTSTLAQNGSSDSFVARLDTNGNWLWATSAGGSEDDGINCLALDAAGNVYVGGGFQGHSMAVGTTVLTNSNPLGTNYDAFVAKLNAQGAWQWARSGGGGSNDGIRSLVLDASGAIYCVGVVEGTATFGPATTVNLIARTDMLVAKLDATGNWLWATRGGGDGLDEGDGIAVDAAGNAYVAGHFDGPAATFGTITLANYVPTVQNNDAVVAKLDAAGTWQWAVRAGGPDNEESDAIALDAAGRLVVAGIFASSPAQFGAFSLTNTATGAYMANSLFLAYLNPATGAWLGATSSQGGIKQMPSALLADAHGNLSLGGSFQGASLGLGATTLAGQPALNTGFVTLLPMVPTVATFAPGSGAPGTVVAVVGTGFAGVTEVLFNGVPAASFTVQSTMRLLATVPVGSTAGPITVRTGAGSSTSGTPFQPVVLAALPATAAALLVWPNPARVAEPWQVQLPAASRTATTRAEVHNALGQLVFETQLSGQASHLPVPRLAPGVYQLTLLPVGQPAVRSRVAVTD